MLGISSIFLFLFIFSILGILRILGMFILSLLNDPPTVLTFSKLEITIFGIFISYTITYLLN